jgi:hypothetical protein
MERSRSFLSTIRQKRLAAIEKQLLRIPDASKDIAGLVLDSYRDYRDYTVRWSAAYFGSIFGSAVLSALAAVLFKLDLLANQAVRNDLATVFATVAALLITLSTIGDFQRKWRANRIAASAIENLAYEILKAPPPDRSVVLTKIQEINAARNEGIVGESPRRSTGATK